jgi:FtsP/CotA-like multicopper oxidase with cupredoxin domain
MGAVSARTTLRMEPGQIEVAGKAAKRYRVAQASGAFGLTLNEGDQFNVRLENGLAVLAGLHWHGLTEPWRQDGVPYLSGPPIAPGAAHDYNFAATPPGTRWMHSHFGLQEQNLLAAPLIIREASAIRSGAQEVVLFLEDFSWTSPEEIFDGLRKRPAAGMAAGAMTSMAGPDLNDVDYDAYLANERTLNDPEVIRVERNGEVRLRIINAGASSNFTIDLGNVQGTLVAVDGNPIAPLPGRRFPVAIAQRADVVLRMPADGPRCRSLPSARAGVSAPASSCSRQARQSPRSARAPARWGRMSGSRRNWSCARARRWPPSLRTVQFRSTSPAP